MLLQVRITDELKCSLLHESCSTFASNQQEMTPAASWVTMIFSRKLLHLAILTKFFCDCASYSPRTNRQNLTGHDVLKASDYEPYIAHFNADDEELYEQYISNENSWNYLENNIPLFDCPDKEFEIVYYFRWWLYRKHIKKIDTPAQSLNVKRPPLDYVITEFLPNVSWSGPFNTISAAAPHHMRGE